MIGSLALSALLACSAADKTDFAAEFKRINNQSLQSLRIDRTKAAEAAKKSRSELEALVKKAESEDASKLTPEDLAAIAQANLQLRNNEGAVKWAELAVKADPKIPSGHLTKVRALLGAKKLVEAEKALENAPPLNPAMKAGLHSQLSLAFSGAGKTEASAKHLKAYVDYQRSNVAANPTLALGFAATVRRLASLQSNDADKLKLVESYVADLQKSAAEKPMASAGLTDLRLLQIELLRSMGRREDADRMLEREILEVEKAHTETTGELQSIHLGRKGKLLTAGIGNAKDESAAAKLRTQLTTFLYDEAVKHRKEPSVVRVATNGLFSTASSLASSDPKSAKAGLDKLTSLMTTLGSDVPDAQRNLLMSQIERISKQIASGLRREELVDKPAPDFKADAWINGSPMSAGDLKGKVVLLDFWAVWCGPCIATFPHLRELHEHYSSQGLVIVGATQYQEYGWNDGTKRPEQRIGIARDDERKETEKFVAHHQLKHAIAFLGDGQVSQAFGVSGIPHVVVIDRKGVVRLVKVGSGDANARAIEAMIKKCLAEPAA